MWDEFRKQLTESDTMADAYADFEAFERWMNTRTNSMSDAWHDVWYEMDTLSRIGLYSIMCDVISHERNKADDKRVATENAVS